jgi:hypothetical protein
VSSRIISFIIKDEYNFIGLVSDISLLLYFCSKERLSGLGGVRLANIGLSGDFTPEMMSVDRNDSSLSS